MPPVFCRSGPNALESYLERWEHLREPYERRAMAWNLRYDHRVTPQREADLRAMAATMPDPDPLHSAIKVYHETTVRDNIHPSFLRNNTENHISGSGTELHPFHQLGTIIDLTSRWRVMDRARLRGHPFFRRFRPEDQISYRSADRGAALWNGPLEQWFWKRDETGKREFLSDFFVALHDAASNPVWVTDWDRLEPLLNESDLRGLQALGMQPREAPRILIALRYPVRDAGIIVRPSQLDAGLYPYHYPSPPSRPLHLGGATMDLETPGLDYLLPEYIHASILFETGHWDAANSWAVKTRSPVLCNLVETRRQHQRKLVREHGAQNPPWIEEF